MDTLEKSALGLKWITNISLVVFCLVTYLGIQGHDNPSMILGFISLVAFVLFIFTLVPSYIINFTSDWKNSSKKKESKSKIVMEYLIPIIVLITLFAWAKFRTQAPLYGEHVIYNPFSIIGLGSKYIGNVIKDGSNIEMQNMNNMRSMNGGNILSMIGFYILKIYGYILTIISTMTYIYGLSWITKADGLISSIISISSIIYTTIGKAILGYVPKNKELMNKDSMFLEFMQYRVYEDNWISKLGAFFRRFTLLGLDVDSLDKIINTPEYDNILPQRPVQEYEKNRAAFDKRKDEGQASFIEIWKWETLPYWWHWLILSSIGYILGGIFLILIHGVK